MTWYLIGGIFLLGMWGLLSKPNMVKKVMALSVSNSAIIIFFVYHGSLSGETAPIEGGGGPMVDPLPQALMLTAIVVGICILALSLVLIYRLYLQFGSLDIREVEKKAWKLYD
ncbi:MAG: cation:proton antiporter subunit C [Spirochaetales bacterium]|nr:cation:proton antiporter subunit C [Spirochaetales bacterium]